MVTLWNLFFFPENLPEGSTWHLVKTRGVQQKNNNKKVTQAGGFYFHVSKWSGRQ